MKKLLTIMLAAVMFATLCAAGCKKDGEKSAAPGNGGDHRFRNLGRGPARTPLPPRSCRRMQARR